MYKMMVLGVDVCRKSIYNIDNRYIDELHKKEGDEDEDHSQNMEKQRVEMPALFYEFDTGCSYTVFI